MNEIQSCAEFVQDRIDEMQGLPTLLLAAKQILTMAMQAQYAEYPDYEGGYADGTEDALRAISGVWRNHPDYEGWADDE